MSLSANESSLIERAATMEKFCHADVRFMILQPLVTTVGQVRDVNCLRTDVCVVSHSDIQISERQEDVGSMISRSDIQNGK